MVIPPETRPCHGGVLRFESRPVRKVLYMLYTYIIESISTGIYYKGSTSDYVRRLEEHNTGISVYTKGKGPWKLIYVQAFETRAEAIDQERRLKRCNKQYLNWLIKQPTNILIMDR